MYIVCSGVTFALLSRVRACVCVSGPEIDAAWWGCVYVYMYVRRVCVRVCLAGHLSAMESAINTFMDTLQDFVQNKKALVACVIVMINPLFWNIVSRYEYRTRQLSKTLGGPKRGCATLAACILTLNYVRTATFHKTVDEFGYWEPLHNGMVEALGYLIVVAGTVLVITSAWKLGFFVCFMGDYFGLLLSDKVTGFPFNVVSDPMYFGSGLIYLGLSLEHASVVGLVLTSCITLSYAVAVRFEGPFTCRIYEERNNMK